jgi:hypothetical protein
VKRNIFAKGAGHPFQQGARRANHLNQLCCRRLQQSRPCGTMVDGSSRCARDATSHCALPLKRLPLLEFLRALVGAFKAGQTFVPRINGFGGVLLDVTNLMG